MDAVVPISYLSVQDVADLVAAQQADAPQPPVKSAMVVDVREDDEYDDGHIIGAAHFPSELWRDESFVKNFLADHMHHEQIIFHCQKSQVRGPTCAKRCAAAVGSYIDQGLLTFDSAPSIHVMRGGFETFDYTMGGARRDLIGER